MLKGLLEDVGLAGYRPFLRDSRFIFALLAAVVVWLVIWLGLPSLFPRLRLGVDWLLLSSLIIGQPLLEEIFFRGVIQGQLASHHWGRVTRWGLSQANWITSVLFVVAHVAYHPPLWAVSVMVPSLVFGYFRDRYGSVYPALALHVYYNAGYFLLGALYVYFEAI